MFDRLMPKADRIAQHKGRANILMENKHPQRRTNFSHRGSFDLVMIRCACGHQKGFDKSLQKIVSGVFCCKCGAKQ